MTKLLITDKTNPSTERKEDPPPALLKISTPGNV